MDLFLEFLKLIVLISGAIFIYTVKKKSPSEGDYKRAFGSLSCLIFSLSIIGAFHIGKCSFNPGLCRILKGLDVLGFAAGSFCFGFFLMFAAPKFPEGISKEMSNSEYQKRLRLANRLEIAGTVFYVLSFLVAMVGLWIIIM